MTIDTTSFNDSYIKLGRNLQLMKCFIDLKEFQNAHARIHIHHTLQYKYTILLFIGSCVSLHKKKYEDEVVVPEVALSGMCVTRNRKLHPPHPASQTIRLDLSYLQQRKIQALTLLP